MKTEIEKNHVEPELNDMLCIRYGPAEWGFSGDRFHSRDGDQITAKQHFANGAIRTTVNHKDNYRVLRGTRLFYIA